MTDERHVLPSIDSPAINVRSSNGISSALNAQVSDDSAKGSQLKYPQSTGQERLDPEALHEKRDAPPDAGTTAWLVVLGAFCGQFVSFGWINCIGVFQTYYETHQFRSMSTSTVAWITSLEVFLMYLGSPLFGTLFDNFGPRRVLLAGTFLHVFGLMMASLSTEYYQLILSQGVCSPLGASAIFNVSVNSVSTWFVKRRAFALGLAAAGSGLGGVIFPIMISQLIPLVGFPWTMRICAFLILFLLCISNLTLRSRLAHCSQPFRIFNFLKPLTELKFVLTVIGTFCFYWSMFLPYSYVISQAERNGMSPWLSAYLIPILNAASIFGRTLTGYIADHFGRFNMMILTTYLSAILVLALWLPSRGNAPAIVFSALYGFSSGAFVSLAPAVVAQISDLREIGVRNGTYFAIISFATLTGTPIGGALVPDVQHGSYIKLQIFSGVVTFAGATFFVLARGSVAGFKSKKV